MKHNNWQVHAQLTESGKSKLADAGKQEMSPGIGYIIHGDQGMGMKSGLSTWEICLFFIGPSYGESASIPRCSRLDLFSRIFQVRQVQQTIDIRNVS